MGLFVRLQLAREFGIGSNSEKQKFLEENGGYKGLRNTSFATVENKLKSYKDSLDRPGQTPQKKPDSKKDPEIKDDTKSNADKEWGKKDEDKLSKLKEDSKEFKKFEAKNKEDAIKEINEAFDKKDLTKLRGIVDKSLDGQKLSPQEKLTAFGLNNKDELVLSGKADKDGVFGLYRAKDTKNPFAKITIDKNGDFKYENIDDKTKKNQLSKNIRTLEEVRNNPEVYKKFEPKSKAETLKLMNETIASKNNPALRGLIDSALTQTNEGKNLSNEQIRDYIGFSETEDFMYISKPDKDGKFHLTNSKNFKTHMQVQDDGSLKEISK